MKRLMALTTTLVVVFFLTSTALMGQYWFYKLDGNHLDLNVLDDMITLKLSPESGVFGSAFAQLKPYLRNDHDSELLAGGFGTYRIENGYTLETVMGLLRADTTVLMVNPVISMMGTDTTLITNNMLVHFHESATESQINALNQSKGITTLRIRDTDTAMVVYVMEYDHETDQTILDICNNYFESGICTYAQPNFMYKHAFFGIPNDSYFEYQWHLHNTGQSGGSVDADIDLPEAYEYREMADTNDYAVVSILDAGFDLNHEDFDTECLEAQYDVCGTDINWPVPDFDASPDCSTHLADGCWHGTAVMGMLASATDNQLGTAGINSPGSQRIRILPIKISSISAIIMSENAVDGLSYAGGKPPRSWAISCSWGVFVPDPAIEYRLMTLHNYGVPVFFAAGNQFVNPGVAFPAYLPTVMAVGASKHDDTRLNESPIGDSLDIVAPGYRMWSWDLPDTLGKNPGAGTCNGDMDYYCDYIGTSFAAPLAAGVAAKVLLRRPDLRWNTDADRIFDVMRHSSEDKGSGGFDTDFGWGRLNADRAMLAVTRGDANNDGLIDIDDVNHLIAYIFVGGPTPLPHIGNGDADCLNKVDLDDVVYLIAYIFTGGPEPPDCFDFDYPDM